MDVNLFVVVCCLVLAVAIIFLLCKHLQRSESRKFNATSAEEFGEADGFGAHGGAAATATGGYVLIPAHMRHLENSKNSKAGSQDKEDKLPHGMDPRDPDAWKRQDSQNDSFAERKEDPWKCDPKPHSTPTTTGIVVAGAAAGTTGVAVAGVATSGGNQSNQPVIAEAHPEIKNPEDGLVVENEKLVNGVDTVDADGKPIPVAADEGPVFSISNTEATALEPKVTIVPIIQDSGPAIVPSAPPPAPAFSTVGFWEAQEAAHAAAKSGGDSYYSGYGNDSGGSSSGYGDSGGRSGGDYGGGYYGTDMGGDSGGGTVTTGLGEDS